MVIDRTYACQSLNDDDVFDSDDRELKRCKLPDPQFYDDNDNNNNSVAFERRCIWMIK